MLPRGTTIRRSKARYHFSTVKFTSHDREDAMSMIWGNANRGHHDNQNKHPPPPRGPRAPRRECTPAHCQRAAIPATKAGRKACAIHRVMASIYNSGVPLMFRSYASSRRLLSCFIFLWLGILSPHTSYAADWTETERQLAANIAAATGPGAISLDVQNRASFTKGDVDTIRRGLASQLTTLGVQVVKPEQAVAAVQVSLTQNLRDYVWVAEVRQGSVVPPVLMVTLTRPKGAINAPPHAPALTVSRSLLWSQESQI